MIAVVVLTHNRVHLLRQCVENVLARASELTTEIVIWDNGSTDGTADYLDSLDDPRIRVVHHPENIGQNAYAEAFRLTSAPFMLELDDDMIDAPAEWDRALLDAFEKLPKVGFLAANLVDDPHDQAARVMYHERAHLYSTSRRTASRSLRGPVGGGCAITSRELHDRVGGFRQQAGPGLLAGGRGVHRGHREARLRGGLPARTSGFIHAGGALLRGRERAKHAYWHATGSARSERTRSSGCCSGFPFVRPLNDRYGWFRISDAPEL